MSNSDMLKKYLGLTSTDDASIVTDATTQARNDILYGTQHIWSFLRKSSSITVSGAETSCPTDFVKLIDPISHLGTGKMMTERSVEDVRGMLAADSTTGIPEFWAIDTIGKKIIVYPKPATSVSMNINYVKIWENETLPAEFATAEYYGAFAILTEIYQDKQAPEARAKFDRERLNQEKRDMEKMAPREPTKFHSKRFGVALNANGEEFTS